MDRETRRAIEEYRRTEAGPLENTLIDELVRGELDRQEFLRRATMLGLGAGVIGALLRYVGEAQAAPSAPGERAQKRGGVLRVGMLPIGASVEPYLLQSGGPLGLAGIPGEYLTFSDVELRVRPWLATSWKPSKDATVWTFQLRKGVKFHNGKTMTADDVVASFKLYVGNPKSQALSVFKGILEPDGVIKRGPYTVEFRLNSPTGVFPYLVSQTTYQCIIQPRELARRPDTWVASGMIGTGPFRLKKYVEKKSAELVRFPQYWGGPAPLDGVKLTFYASSAAMVLALRAGQIDLAQQLSAQEAQPFRNNPRFTVYSIPTAAHRQFCLRVDRDPHRDPRVRRAIAFTLGRPELIEKILLGHGTLGNDSPFWSKFPSTDPSIKQRKKNVALARALLQAAGQPSPKIVITTHNFLDLPQYAAAIQADAKAAGIDVALEIMSTAEYYDGDPSDYYGTTPWIVKPATITEWGARAVPNVYITSAFMSDGIWNASHYKNPEFDSAARTYLAASDLQSQRKATKRMAGLLLRDTPVVIAYFINYTTVSSSKVKGYVPDGISHVRLAKTYLG
jgi:peptide/nickel transport system substrate-binding protein